MSCRVYILLLLALLDTLQVAYGRNCTRLFHCRILYSTFCFHLLSVGSEKFVFNLTYAKFIFRLSILYTFESLLFQNRRNQ